MAVCRHCSRTVKDASNFCPYCGRKLDAGAVVPAAPAPVKAGKTLSKKTIALIALLLAAVIGVGTVISWEVKIDRARAYYVQGEYWQAYWQVRKIPSLGREEVIRYKIAGDAGEFYKSFLTIKRIRLSSTSSRHPDAYRDAFWELTFGLMLNKRWVQEDGLNDIEIDEYEKFIEIHYEELEDVFSMSSKEADRLTEAMEAADEVSDMKELANQWLEENFF